MGLLHSLQTVTSASQLLVSLQFFRILRYKTLIMQKV